MNKVQIITNNIKKIKEQRKITKETERLYLLSLKNFEGCLMYEDFLGDEDIYNNNIIYKCSLSSHCNGTCSASKKNQDILNREKAYRIEQQKLKDLRFKLFENIFCR